MVHAFTIGPVSYMPFEDETEQIDRCKEWGLLSGKAVKLKTFYYKGNGVNMPCTVVGYVDAITAVIRFDNDQLHCIHPSYLKEMQTASFGTKGSSAAAGAEDNVDAVAAEENPAGAASEDSINSLTADDEQEHSSAAADVQEAPANTDDQADAPAPTPAAKKSKAKKEKVQLPEEKVGMTAKVQEFATVPNHFSDNDDEVIIYEAVAIIDPAIELDTAWSSYSATLKKLELEVGDTITFEAKVVAKKLTKHPVPYKINNPSKLKKV
jgi:hypothetical protein